MAQFVGGRYQLIAQLGGGGMADVFLAKLTGKADFAKLAVVKRLKPLEDDDAEVVRMFADEARLCARLNHPAIVQTFEVGEDTTGPFLVMEYLEGQPLGRIRSRAAKRELAIPRAVALQIVRDTVGALAYAHSLQDHDGTPLHVVHRDVSPENIMVTYAGVTKLVDFGVAKTVTSHSRTRAGVLKGKVAYMAPEQARSDATIDERADVFAVGLILWELLTNQRLWEGNSEAQVFERLLDKDPLPRAKSIVEDVPAELDDICAKAIEKRREDRFATASDLLDALERACAKYDLRATDRTIGQFVSNLFETERERVKALVSGSMTKSGEGKGGSLIPQAGTAAVDSKTPRASESDPMIWQAISSSPAIPNVTPGGGANASSMPAAETPAGVADTRPRVDPPETKGGASRFGYLAGVVALVAVAVLVGTRLKPGDSPTPVATAPPDLATTPPPSTSTSTPTVDARDVAIDVNVKPASAKIFVDAKSVVGNPYHLKAPRADGNHEIRAEAEGYESRSVIVAFDRDRAIDLVLEKAKKGAPLAVASGTRPAQHAHLATAPTSAAPSAAPPPPPASPTGISEIEPSKPKPASKDKIDTDVFRR